MSRRSIYLYSVCILPVLALIGLPGCGNSDPAASEQNDAKQSPPLTAQETLMRFMVARANNDTETADSLCADDCKGWGADLVIDPDSIEVTDPLVEGSPAAGSYGDFYDAVELGVTYTLLEGDEWEPAGITTRFSMLVKETADSPWRVLSFGTGP